MVKIKNSFMAKTLSFILVLTIMLGMIPPAVLASAATDSMATIESLVSGGILEDSNTVMFSNTELVWSAKNASIGRNFDGWWVGIKVTAPEGITLEDLQNAKYQSKSSGDWSADKLFWSYKDSADNATEHYIQLWGLVNEQYINDAIANGKDIEIFACGMDLIANADVDVIDICLPTYSSSFWISSTNSGPAERESTT